MLRRDMAGLGRRPLAPKLKPTLNCRMGRITTCLHHKFISCLIHGRRYLGYELSQVVPGVHIGSYEPTIEHKNIDYLSFSISHLF